MAKKKVKQTAYQPIMLTIISSDYPRFSHHYCEPGKIITDLGQHEARSCHTVQITGLTKKTSCQIQTISKLENKPVIILGSQHIHGDIKNLIINLWTPVTVILVLLAQMHMAHWQTHSNWESSKSNSSCLLFIVRCHQRE